MGKKDHKYQLTRHHRKPRVLGGKDNPENIALVRNDRHCAFHLLFDEGAPIKVAHRLNKDWIDPAFEMVVVPKEYAEGIRNRIASYIKTSKDGKENTK